MLTLMRLFYFHLYFLIFFSGSPLILFFLSLYKDLALTVFLFTIGYLIPEFLL